MVCELRYSVGNRLASHSFHATGERSGWFNGSVDMLRSLPALSPNDLHYLPASLPALSWFVCCHFHSASQKQPVYPSSNDALNGSMSGKPTSRMTRTHRC